jgi:hypothetical protein
MAVIVPTASAGVIPDPEPDIWSYPADPSTMYGQNYDGVTFMDILGSSEFRQTINDYIINPACSGFDANPTDIGEFLAAALRNNGETCDRVEQESDMLKQEIQDYTDNFGSPPSIRVLFLPSGMTWYPGNS